MAQVEEALTFHPPGDVPGWFGDGTPFDRAADLTAALDRLSQVAPSRPVLVPGCARDEQLIEAAGTEAPETGAPKPRVGDVTDHVFEVIDPRGGAPTPIEPVSAPPKATSVPTWSVRKPGVDPLPQQQPGGAGWSMQNSIVILRRAEELMMRLRQDAVVAAFNAASRALRS